MLRVQREQCAERYQDRSSTEQLSTSRLHDGLIRGEIHSTLLASAKAIDAAPSVMRSPLSLAELTLNLYSVDGPGMARSREELRNSEIIVLRSYGYGGLRAWMSAPEQRPEDVLPASN